MVWLLTSLAALVVAWLVLALVLYLRRPEPDAVKAGLRVLPDTVRLVRRLATDSRAPRSSRALLWLLVIYLLSPLDLVPDFIPIIGFADDVVLTGLVLRHLVRRAGPEVLEEQWPGSDEGLASLRTLLRVSG